MVRKLIAMLFALALVAAACGDSDDDGDAGTDATTEADGDAGANSVGGGDASVCGLGTGEEATGEPLSIGAVVDMVPGVDFSDEANGAQAYFDCVNANGGINGRPIDYIVENSNLDPAATAAAAVKLWEDDGVVAMTGNMSIIDCTVNGEYYTNNGVFAIIAGVDANCYASPNFASVNAGPRYSAQGATEAVFRAGARDTVVLVTGNIPGSDISFEQSKLFLDSVDVAYEEVFLDLPVADGNSAIIDIVGKAGPDGGVVLLFTPPEALTLMTAAIDQGLQGDVSGWGCATPCNDSFLISAVGTDWDDVMLIDAELARVDTTGPDMLLYVDVMDTYQPDTPIGSFSQMGFLAARLAVDGLLNAEGDITQASAAEAFKAIINFETDLLCKPWYFGDLPFHVPDNTTQTITMADGSFITTEECREYTAVDETLIKTREFEVEQGLNTGS